MNSTHIDPAHLHPLAELRGWIAVSVLRSRLLRQFSAVARLEIAAEITAEAIASSHSTAVAAHSAETHDREALRLLDSVLADGAVHASELSALRRVRSLVAHSASTDHTIAERSEVPPPAA
jgi:hypothetical protein